jgi:hypothetical protein
LTLLLPQALADDASNGVMLPGMQSSPLGSVRVLAARVVLHADTIVLSVTTDVPPGDLGHIVIHGPRFGWMGEAEPYPERQFPELQASVDGTPVTVTSHVSAFAGSTDISATLRDARLDPFTVAQTPPFVSAVAGHEVAFNQLVALGAIQPSEDGSLAQWEVARVIDVTLGGGGQHMLALTYAARPAYALIPFHQLATKLPLASYCLSKAKLAEVLGHSAADRAFDVQQYAVSVGVDNKPVAKVQVSVTASGKPNRRQALIVFCGGGGRAVIGRGSNASAAQTDPRGVIHILAIR